MNISNCLITYHLFEIQVKRTEEAQKYMKRLSLVSVGFDEQLATRALEAHDYDITSAVQYCQEQENDGHWNDDHRNDGAHSSADSNDTLESADISD